MVKIKNTEQKVTEELNKKADSSKNEENAVKTKKAAGKDTVTVACGIPMGLRLKLNGEEILLKGVPMSHIVSSIKGVGYLPAGKYGLTTLPKEKWEALAEKYKKADFIRNGVIFATDSYEETTEMAVEKSGKNLDKNLGFDQIDPKKSGKTAKSKNEE